MLTIVRIDWVGRYSSGLSPSTTISPVASSRAHWVRTTWSSCHGWHGSHTYASGSSKRARNASITGGSSSLAMTECSERSGVPRNSARPRRTASQTRCSGVRASGAYRSLSEAEKPRRPLLATRSGCPVRCPSSRVWCSSSSSAAGTAVEAIRTSAASVLVSSATYPATVDPSTPSTSAASTKNRMGSVATSLSSLPRMPAVVRRIEAGSTRQLPKPPRVASKT